MSRKLIIFTRENLFDVGFCATYSESVPFAMNGETRPGTGDIDEESYAKPINVTIFGWDKTDHAENSRQVLYNSNC